MESEASRSRFGFHNLDDNLINTLASQMDDLTVARFSQSSRRVHRLTQNYATDARIRNFENTHARIFMAEHGTTATKKIVYDQNGFLRYESVIDSVLRTGDLVIYNDYHDIFIIDSVEGQVTSYPLHLMSSVGDNKRVGFYIGRNILATGRLPDSPNPDHWYYAFQTIEKVFPELAATPGPLDKHFVMFDSYTLGFIFAQLRYEQLPETTVKVWWHPCEINGKIWRVIVSPLEKQPMLVSFTPRSGSLFYPEMDFSPHLLARNLRDDLRELMNGYLRPDIPKVNDMIFLASYYIDLKRALRAETNF